MFERLVLGLGLFVGSLAIGRWLSARGALSETRAAWLIRLVVTKLSPCVLCLSFWRLEITDRSLWILPVLGCIVSVTALLPAWAYARLAQLSAPQTGSMLTCALVSNLGFLGAFTAFALHGEVAYGLAMWYLVYFSPCFYVVGFALAKRFGQQVSASGQASFLSDQLRLLPLLGLLLGLVLSVTRVPRPAIFESINRALIPLDTAMYLAAIGSQLTWEPIGRWRMPCAVMSVIKFVYSPLIAWALVQLGHVQGLPRFIVLLQAAMPVAISPLMLPMLFGLDRRLSNALWLFTTVLAIPWLLIYLPLIR